jgi:hypothetical protein
MTPQCAHELHWISYFFEDSGWVAEELAALGKTRHGGGIVLEVGGIRDQLGGYGRARCGGLQRIIPLPGATACHDDSGNCLEIPVPKCVDRGDGIARPGR